MRPCYQGELGWDRFVPLTVPLSTNISSWPFRACSLPVAGGLSLSTTSKKLGWRLSQRHFD